MQWVKRLVLVAAMLLSGPAYAQTVDWRAELGADQVTLRDGKMVYEEFAICEFGGLNEGIQIRYYAEVPLNAGISRDYFLASTVGLNVVMVFGFMAEAVNMNMTQFLESFECAPINAPIGTVDIEFNLYMTAEGFQVEVVDTAIGERTRSAMTWEQLYAD